MVKSLLKILKPSSKVTEEVTQVDISRVVGVRKAPKRDAVNEAKDTTKVGLDIWMKRDLDLLQMSWQDFFNNAQDNDAERVFRSALHNLYGASGAYGGGALTDLTESLQKLLIAEGFDPHSDAALVELHIQACRAAAFEADTTSAETTKAVCEALKGQVTART